MTSATLKTSGVCAATPVANYYYDADNLRVVKQSLNASGAVTKFTTSMRGGLDALADFTTHVADGQESSRPFEQKNYIYGPGGLIASEKRSLSILGRPRWQIYGQSTGCAVNDSAATATNLISNGYDLALDFGACASATVTSMTLEWHELNSNGTPKHCTSQETDTTTNFNARYNCGLLHLNPAIGTELLHKLKYDIGYSVKVTEHVNLGLLGEREFVVSQFTVNLPHNATAAQLAYNNTLAPPDDGGGSELAAPGPSGRFVEYYQKDHLGTIRVVSNESGAVESTHDYEPFGLELPGQDPSDNTHRFTGHERDTETDLDYMKARYYGAGMGRFAIVDPTRRSIEISDTQTWNRFTYSLDNPINRFDLDGNISYLVARNGPLWSSHMFIVTHARYLGDPKARIYSWGKTTAQGKNGNLGRVDDKTTGFSKGTNDNDRATWLALGKKDDKSKKIISETDATKINANDGRVLSVAEALKENKPYHGLSGPNSNSAAQAVADQSQGSVVKTPEKQDPAFAADESKQVEFDLQKIRDDKKNMKHEENVKPESPPEIDEINTKDSGKDKNK